MRRPSRILCVCFLTWVLALSSRTSAQVGGPAPGGPLADSSHPSTAGAPDTAGAGQQVLTPPRWLEPSSPPWPGDTTEDEAIEVQLHVTVDAQGRVIQAEADPGFPAPGPHLLRTARDFMSSQRFEPATRNGQPIPARISIQLNFIPPTKGTTSPPTTTTSPEPRQHSATEPKAAPAMQGPYPVHDDYGAQATITHSRQAVSATDMELEVGALHEVPRSEAAQLLTLSPGVVLTNHSGQGHAPSIFLRGFDAGEGQDLEVRVTGVPINEPSNAHGHGYADAGFLVPEFVRRVHVAQGPFDPRQGNFSAAGSVDYELGAPDPGSRIQGSIGSFGERRALISWSPPDGSRDSFAAADVTQGAGFGHNRSHRNMRGLAQVVGEVAGADYQLLLASHGLTFDAAGVVRGDAVNTGQVDCGDQDLNPSYCVLDPNQGGQADRHLVSARAESHAKRRAWAQQVALMVRGSRFRENFTGTRLDPRGDGLDQQTQMTTLFMRGHYRMRERMGGQPQSLELGYEGRHDRGTSSMWRLRRVGQAPYATVFDNELALTHIGLYAAGILTFSHYANLQLGGRIDTFGYNVTDRAQPTSDRMGERLPRQTINAWGSNLQPRTTLTLGPHLGVRWLTSFGIGSRSSDAAALSEGETAPFTRVIAAESGLAGDHFLGALHAESRMALFYAHVDRDLLFDETAGRNVPIGATNRFGAYGHVRVRYAERIDLSTSFTWAEAHAPGDGTALGFDTGPRLPYVPRWVLRTDAAYRDSFSLPIGDVHLGTGLGVSWVGPRPLPLDTLSRAIFNVDASLRVRFRFLEWSLSATNLTDRLNRSAEYFYASDFGTDAPTMTRARHFSAAPPRAFLTSLALVLEV